ncbi:hypothetical protein SeMB42_g00041 [Synchytrium endobioticum]|uniref:BolA protein n=1 Tax=Synchytrium endobioticum TaxID=286115 RepID=A0A507DVU1_9FUNG|nr:hypothetical protein SeMB42_g00041 [Synchytrium endobioticum]
MLRTLRGIMTSSLDGAGPIYTAIHTKITDKLQPTVLDIIDDSHLHASHAAMRAEGNKHKETHFRVTVVSDSFHGKPIVARHRMIYDLLSDEFKVGGLHALSLNTKTPSEFKPPSE